jgi:preprotein translocase subunit Sss1
MTENQEIDKRSQNPRLCFKFRLDTPVPFLAVLDRFVWVHPSWQLASNGGQVGRVSRLSIKRNGQMFKKLAILFGVVFVLVGILGFVPALAPRGSDGMRYLLGLFMVGTVHNLIHLLSGVAALIAGFTSEKYAKYYFQIFGIVYGLVTVIGFIQQTTVLGLFPIDLADNFLHLALSAVILFVGFGLKSSKQLKAQVS